MNADLCLRVRRVCEVAVPNAFVLAWDFEHHVCCTLSPQQTYVVQQHAIQPTASAVPFVDGVRRCTCQMGPQIPGNSTQRPGEQL